jgi:2'-5' RNA ligase
MSKNSAIVYWLMPADPERELFCDIIRILYKQFDAPNFDPHLTILVAKEDGESPANVLKQIKASPIRLAVREIAIADEFTKTLFVRMEPSKSLEKLVVDLGHAVKSKTETVDDPHVSLLYKKLATPVKKELASTIQLPFSEVTFDSIKAVRCDLPVESSADVEAWRVVATKSLGE